MEKAQAAIVLDSSTAESELARIRTTIATARAAAPAATALGCRRKRWMHARRLVAPAGQFGVRLHACLICTPMYRACRIAPDLSQHFLDGDRSGGRCVSGEHPVRHELCVDCSPVAKLQRHDAYFMGSGTIRHHFHCTRH